MDRRSLAILVATVLAAGALVASATSALALPAYSAATGEPCGTCHVNPAGGGALTAKGSAFAAVSSHASNPAAAWQQVNAPAPAAPAPAAPAPAAPAPAAPAPSAGKAAPAPAALPSTGEGAVASALPSILGTLGLFTAGLGYGMAKIGRRRR